MHFTTLGLNKIDCDGARLLPRIKWATLKKISICIYFYIKGEIILRLMIYFTYFFRKCNFPNLPQVLIILVRWKQAQ